MTDRSTIDAAEARAQFESLLDRVESGEEIAITKDGRIVARLIPTTASARPDPAAAIKRFRRDATLGEPGWKALRDEGRR